MSDSFAQAQADISKLKGRPSNNDLLQLYALSSQATRGDIPKDGPPSANDPAGRAKWNAWKDVTDRGLSQDDAKEEYVELVEKLKADLGFDAA
jgi:diazepam-binding inhibitor (GABA receptor modulating acyl-CoA-binding protein)